ncbi:glycine betaine/L-proline ABC transporter ATP-binding protein, partial [Burkholderia multivorans]
MSRVRVRNLTKVFGRNSQKALKMVKNGDSKQEILEKTGATVGVYDASFDVEDGEIFVIMGLSGSGKSTLVRLINRLIEPTSGSVYINEDDVSKMSKNELREVRRTKVNMVFQNFGLFPKRTVLENAEYGLEIRGVEKEARRKQAEKALEDTGLLSFKDQYPNQLSGGMQQSVGC